MWKLLSQGIQMCNMKALSRMKALSLLVWKLWPRLKFLKSRSIFKIKFKRSKIKVPCERSCHKEYTLQHESTITSGLKVMAKVSIIAGSYWQCRKRFTFFEPDVMQILRRIGVVCCHSKGCFSKCFIIHRFHKMRTHEVFIRSYGSLQFLRHRL